MNPYMMFYIAGRVAASTIKMRLGDQRRRARDATGPRKHSQNWAGSRPQRDSEPKQPAR